jgi:hypothetical protein
LSSLPDELDADSPIRSTIHVLIAEQAALDPLKEAAARGGTISWIVPKSANTGDKVLLFFRPWGFLGHGKIMSKPKAAMFGKRHTYSAGVGGTVVFDSPVPLETVAERFSEWAWVRYPRSFTTLKSPLAERVLEFVSNQPQGKQIGFLLPEEIAGATTPLVEGAVTRVMVNAYERNAEARRRCIEHHGTDCCICGFSFGAMYGEVANGYIHIHHLRPLSEINAKYVVDPVEDLRPVCPNCHAVLHRRVPAYSIEEVRLFMNRPPANG